MATARVRTPNYFQSPMSIDISGASPIALYAAAGGAPATPAVGGKGLKPKGVARTPYENEQIVMTAFRLVNESAANTVTVVVNDGPGGSPLLTLVALPGETEEQVGEWRGARGAIPEFVVTGTTPTGSLLIQQDTKTLNDSPRPAAGTTDQTI